MWIDSQFWKDLCQYAYQGWRTRWSEQWQPLTYFKTFSKWLVQTATWFVMKNIEMYYRNLIQTHSVSFSSRWTRAPKLYAETRALVLNRNDVDFYWIISPFVPLESRELNGKAKRNWSDFPDKIFAATNRSHKQREALFNSG